MNELGKNLFGYGGVIAFSALVLGGMAHGEGYLVARELLLKTSLYAGIAAGAGAGIMRASKPAYQRA